MEQKLEVKVFQVYYTCDICKIGTMEYMNESIGFAILDIGNIEYNKIEVKNKTYNHICGNPDCKKTSLLERQYPYLSYEM